MQLKVLGSSSKGNCYLLDNGKEALAIECGIYTFAGLNNILIECNFRQDILDANVESGRLPSALRARTMKSHMEYETCKGTLLANDLSGVNNIVLIHLSDGNSNASEFRQGIMEATGKTIHIAESGMTLNFNKSPF